MRKGAGMPPSTAVGTAQSRVLADVRQNGRHTRGLMEQAAAAGARVVHRGRRREVRLCCLH
jgi:hypothetical protein